MLNLLVMSHSLCGMKGVYQHNRTKKKVFEINRKKVLLVSLEHDYLEIR